MAGRKSLNRKGHRAAKIKRDGSKLNVGRPKSARKKRNATSAKSARKKKRRSPTKTTPRSSGGAGFDFADKVCAYASLLMLKGAPWIGESQGRVARLLFEGDALDWEFDDLIVEVVDETGQSARASSIKDRQSLNFKKDVFERGWRQLATANGPFTYGRDRLIFAVSQRAKDGARSLLDLCDLARRWSNETEFRMQVARAAIGVRKLLTSLDSTRPLRADDGPEFPTSHQFLQSLDVLVLNFDEGLQPTRHQALADCRDVLTEGTNANALSLWDKVLTVVKPIRAAGGDLSLSTLVQKLKGQFRLRHFPDLRPDWIKIHEHNQRVTSEHQSTLPDGTKLDRSKLVASLLGLLEKSGVVSVVGLSGVGKTVLLEDAAATQGNLIWLNDQSFAPTDQRSVRKQLGLDHELTFLANHSTSGPVTIVIDRVERVSKPDGSSLLSAFIDQVRQDAPTTRVLIAYQQEKQDRVEEGLTACKGLKGRGQFIVPPLSQAELQDFAHNHAPLQSLLGRSDAADLLGRPLFLGLLINASDAIGDQSLVSESDFALLYWRHFVENAGNAASIGAALFCVATLLADGFVWRLPVGDIQPVGALDPLNSANVINIRFENVSFAHDLYLDWTLFRFVLSAHERGESIQLLNAKATQPVWHRAIRLLGEWLLSRPDGEQRFTEICNQVNADARALLFDGLVTSGLAQQLLPKVMGPGETRSGQHIAQFLFRFLRTATAMDDSFLGIAAGDDASAAARHRWPVIRYWPPLLRYLGDQGRDHIQEHREHIAALLLVLFKLNDLDTEVVALSRSVYMLFCVTLLPTEDEPRSQDDQVLYEAMLWGAKYFPAEASAFSLVASRRALASRGPSNDPPESSGDADNQPLSIRPEILLVPEVGNFAPALSIELNDEARRYIRQPLTDPRPQGDVPDAMRQAFFSPTTIWAPIILALHQPAIAREALLAVLLAPPRRRTREHYASSRSTEERFGVEHLFGVITPLWFHGPFFRWLRSSPRNALDALLTFVDVVSRKAAAAAGGRFTTLEFAGPRGPTRLIGPSDWMFAHRQLSTVPMSVECALMALEKWLADALDSGQEIQSVVEHIVKNDRSAMTVGVLISLAKRKPVLLKGSLQFLLSNPELLLSDTQVSLHEGSSLMFLSYEPSAFLREKAREWHGASWRSKPLRDTVLDLWLNDASWNAAIDNAKNVWRKSLAHEDDTAIANMLKAFDRDRYVQVKHPDGQQVWAFRATAEEFDDARKADNESAIRLLPLRATVAIEKATALPIEEAASLAAVLANSSAFDFLQPTEATNSVVAGWFLVWTSQGMATHEASTVTAWHVAAMKSLLRWLESRNPDDLQSHLFSELAACLAIRLWIEKPDDPEMRRFLATVLAASRQEDIEKAMFLAGRHHQTLAFRLSCLSEFVLSLGELRVMGRGDQHDWFETAEEEAAHREAAAHLDELFIQDVDQFVSATNCQSPLTLIEAAAQRKTLHEGLVNSPYWTSPAFVHYLPTAYCYFLSAQAEQSVSLDNRVEATKALVSLMTADVNNEAQVEGGRLIQPHSWHKFVLALLGRTMVQMESAGRPSAELYTPILEMVPFSVHFVYAPVFDAIAYGFGSPEHHAALGRAWAGALKQVLARWDDLASQVRWRELDDLVGEASRLPFLKASVWDDAENAAAIGPVRELLPSWCEKLLQYREAFSTYASFLTETSDLAAIEAGVSRFSPHLTGLQGTAHDAESRRTALRNFVEHCWKVLKRRIIADEQLRAGYLAILAALAETGDQVALELQSRVRLAIRA